MCSNTGSFTAPRDGEGRPSSLNTARSADFSFFAHTHTQQNNKYDIESVCHGLNDDDRAMLALCSERQESLKAPTTQQIIGKKRQEATQQQVRAYRLQFPEAKQLERKCPRMKRHVQFGHGGGHGSCSGLMSFRINEGSSGARRIFVTTPILRGENHTRGPR